MRGGRALATVALQYAAPSHSTAATSLRVRRPTDSILSPLASVSIEGQGSSGVRTQCL